MAIKRARNNAEYEKVDNASILTMKHYFKDPAWFDKKGMFAERISDGQRQGATAHPPKKCPICNLVFQKSIRQDNQKITYLNRSVFEGVRLIKEICDGCI